VRPGDHCVSIASAGDNTLALLTRDPDRVVAVDRSAAQLACLGLRIAAYRCLDHAELLELLGARPSERRWALYERCRSEGQLHDVHARFWDERRHAIEAGIGSAGRFEAYFGRFRRRVLPLIHRRAVVMELLRDRSPQEREAFYRDVWDGWRWRLLFRVFFSRASMGRLGRDPAFFRYAEGPLAPRVLARARHAMTTLNPAANPYMQWILLGRYGEALPVALLPEHFESIRARLDRITLHHGTLESALAAQPPRSVHRFNLSDVFEYLSLADTARLLACCVDAGVRGGRLVYWNMIVPRSRPDELAARLIPLEKLACSLHARDRAFFYQRLVIEEIAG
jgi:S-adenosylmethionine-diacylglycerol 3-amino-3-carboxypropyl transferase